MSISWEPVEKATTYNIYWSNESDVQISGSTKIKDVTSPYSHEGLSNGSSYYYVVTAVNTYGESGISQEVYATPHTNPDNARTRVVWVQEMGDGRDVDHGQQFSLDGVGYGRRKR